MANRIMLGPLIAIPLLMVSVSVSNGQGGQVTGAGSNTGIAPSIPALAASSPQEAQVTIPTVVCNGNQLTISASNSTLESVLTGVHSCSGIKIDMPDLSGAGRVFENLGPGSARDVLTSLLSDSGFDFVIGSSDSNPDKVETVLLLGQGASTPVAIPADIPMTPARRAYLQMHPNVSRPDAAPTDYIPPGAMSAPDPAENSNPAPASAENPAPGANQAPTGDLTPPVIQPRVPLPDGQIATPLGASTAPIDPSNVNDQITNMEKMFQQRSQMNQNQNTQPPK